MEREIVNFLTSIASHNRDLIDIADLFFKNVYKLEDNNLLFSDAAISKEYIRVSDDAERVPNYDKLGGLPYTYPGFKWPKYNPEVYNTEAVRTDDDYGSKYMLFVGQFTDPRGTYGTLQIFVNPKNSHDAFVRQISYMDRYLPYKITGEPYDKDNVWRINWGMIRMLKSYSRLSKVLTSCILHVCRVFRIEVDEETLGDLLMEYYDLNSIVNDNICQFGGRIVHTGQVDRDDDAFQIGPVPIYSDIYKIVVSPSDILDSSSYSWERNVRALIFVQHEQGFVRI